MNSTVEVVYGNTFVCMIAAVSYTLTVTLPANASVLWLILREDRLVPDIFYFNLSLEELFVTLWMTWALISAQYSCTSCFEAFAFFQGLFFTARPLFQFLICLECYMGVNHPVLFLRLKPPKYRLTCCIGVWLLICASCVYNTYTHTNMLYLFAFFVQNLFILLAIFFCLLSVLRTLRRPGPGGNNERKKSNRTKTRAFKIISVTLASMTLNFLLCTGPIPLQLYTAPETFKWVYTLCTNLALLIGSMQPVIYLQRAQKILCVRRH